MSVFLGLFCFVLFLGFDPLLRYNDCLFSLRSCSVFHAHCHVQRFGLLVATGSMDHTAKLRDVEHGKELFNLEGHKAEIVSLSFNTDGDKIMTSSFDNTAKIWDVMNG